jgi:hypothetical protein
MIAGLANAVALTAWGAHAVVPWRLRRAGRGSSDARARSDDGEASASATVEGAAESVNGGEVIDSGEAEPTVGASAGDRDEVGQRSGSMVLRGSASVGGSPAAYRRRWALAALPVLVVGLVAGLAYMRARPDAAIAVGLLPVTANLPGRLIALFLPAVLLVDLLLLVARDRLEDAGWAIAAAFGLLLAAAGALAGELLRLGEGPGGPRPALLGATACRLLLALAAGELLAPSRPLLGRSSRRSSRPIFRPEFPSILAPIAGLALPVYVLLLPSELQQAMIPERVWLTLGAAALLLVAAPWAPARLRRATLAAGVLLACLALGRAADLSQKIPPPARATAPAVPGR